MILGSTASDAATITPNKIPPINCALNGDIKLRIRLKTAICSANEKVLFTFTLSTAPIIPQLPSVFVQVVVVRTFLCTNHLSEGVLHAFLFQRLVLHQGLIFLLHASHYLFGVQQ